MIVNYRAVPSGESLGRCPEDEHLIGVMLACANPGVLIVDDPVRPGRKAAQCLSGPISTPGTLICAK